MRMTASTNTVRKIMLMPMPNRRAGEKLGEWEEVSAMSSPAAALHGPQSQEQKEEAQQQAKHDGPRIHRAARKIIHLFDQREIREHLLLPRLRRANPVRQQARHEQSGPPGQADYGCDHLCSRDCGGQTTQ